MQADLAETTAAGRVRRSSWAGEGEWKITVDVFRDLGLAFRGALVGIYILLVVETELVPHAARDHGRRSR